VALTKIQPNIIAVANNVTNKTVGNTTSIPSFTFDGAGVVTSASNVAISGAGITANTVANSAFQTGSVENYLNAQGLDFGMRNRIINGTMIVDQRNAGANVVISSNAPYTVDRWRAQVSQHNGTMNVRQDSTSTAGFTKSLRAIVTTANTSLPATSVTRIWTNIEGLNVADLGFGTANAKPVTLSFWVRSSNTGTFSGALTNYDEVRSYPFEYTISTANTFEKKTITIPGDTSGNWSSNTDGSFALNFNLGSGTTQLGTANAWTGSWKVGSTGSFSLAGVLNATWYVTGVQLEEGSIPTSFEYRQYGTELALCHRYFLRYGGTGNYEFINFTTLIATGSGTAYGCVQNPVQMRTVPTYSASNLRVVDENAAYTVTSISGSGAVYGNNYGTEVAFNVSSGLTQYRPYFVQINNGTSTSHYLYMSAEL